MTTPTWHLGYARVTLEKWYNDVEYFMQQAKELSRIPFQSKQVGFAKRQALVCKTLGLVFHDRYKLLLEDK